MSTRDTNFRICYQLSVDHVIMNGGNKRVYSLPLIKTNRLKNSFTMHHAAKAT